MFMKVARKRVAVLLSAFVLLFSVFNCMAYASTGTGVVTGIVKDLATHMPLEGVEVKVYSGSDGAFSTPPVGTFETGSDGQYTFTDVPAGSFYFTFKKSGFLPVTWLSGSFTVADGGTTTVADYEMAFSQVYGMVMDTSGLMIENAAISVVGTVYSATSREGSGYFSIENVPYGAHQISVSKTGYQTYTSSPFTVVDGQYNGLGNIVLQADSPVQPTLSSLTISSSTLSVPKGVTHPITAVVIASYSDSTTLDVSSQVAWTSSNESIAKITATGGVEGVSEGTATLTGIYGGLTVTRNVTITAPEENGNMWSTSTLVNLQTGTSGQSTVKAIYSDGSKVDVTSSAVWTSEDTSIATVTNGLITAVKEGTTKVYAVYKFRPAIEFTVTVTDTPPVTKNLIGLTSNPNLVQKAVGVETQLVITGLYDDASTADVTDQATFTSSNTAIATVSPTGVVKGVAVGGGVTINITVNGKSTSVPVVVTAPIQDAVTVSRTAVGPINPGGYADIIAKAHYTDGSEVTLANASWASSDNDVATVSQTGRISAVSNGTATITVSYGGFSATVTVTVATFTASVVSLTANTTVTVIVGEQASLGLVAHLDDDTTINAGPIATLSSSNSDVADYVNGKVLGVSAGTATITATLGGKSTSIAVTVVPRQTGNNGYYPPPTSPSKPEPTPTPDPVQTPTPEKPVLKGDVVDAAKLKEEIKTALETAPAKKFEDLADTHWSAKAVEIATKIGFVSGNDDGTFRANESVTRAEFATMLVKALGIKPKGSDNFADAQGSWAASAIAALKTNGIVNGYGDGTFKPDQEISRAEMVAILSKIMNLSPDTGASKFNDTKGSWAEQSINQLAAAGIISGKGEGKFDPNAIASRGESVILILRVLNVNLDLGLEL